MRRFRAVRGHSGGGDENAARQEQGLVECGLSGGGSDGNGMMIFNGAVMVD